MCRLMQTGKLNGVDVVQCFYLVAHEDGRQMALTFCMTPRQVDRLVFTLTPSLLA